MEIQTAFEDFVAVKDALVSAGFEPANAEITMVASTQVPLELESAEKLLALVDQLEDLDDVQNVYTNADISSAVMEQLG